MIQNPYLTIPQVESDSSRSWEQGFLYGFQGPDQSSTAQGDVETADSDAFNQGVLDGQTAAINGLELDNSCVDLNVEPPSMAHFAVDAGVEGVFAITTLIGKHFIGLGAEGILAVINLSIALETFSDDPDQALKDRADRLQDQLTALGFTGSMELFFGGGVDLSQKGCELKATPIFRHQDDATKAARALGRGQWLVVGWRSDQCAGLRTIESSGL